MKKYFFFFFAEIKFLAHFFFFFFFVIISGSFASGLVWGFVCVLFCFEAGFLCVTALVILNFQASLVYNSQRSACLCFPECWRHHAWLFASVTRGKNKRKTNVKLKLESLMSPRRKTKN